MDQWASGQVGEGDARGSAKVQRWKGEDKWTSGRVDKWDREMQEAVQKCKGGKEDEMVSGARCQVSGNEGVFYLQFLKFF